MREGVQTTAEFLNPGAEFDYYAASKEIGPPELLVVWGPSPGGSYVTPRQLLLTYE
jgi:hypothetical protein